MTWTERAVALRAVIESLSQNMSRELALDMPELLPSWEKLCRQEREVGLGFMFRFDAELFETAQPLYRFTKLYVPGQPGTESLFTRIDRQHSGSADDPILWKGNMLIHQGLYYLEDSVLYLGIRHSLQPLSHSLKELSGHYVQPV